MPRPAHVDLPDPDLLQRRLRVFALVDAIVSPEFRSFELHPRWGKGETVGAFKNGSGDFFFAWSSERGHVVRGFDHESAMSPFRHDPPQVWPRLLDELPAALEYALREPAFGGNELTFCFWRAGADWLRADYELPAGADPDGARQVLACLQPNFARWAAGYYGAPLPKAPLAAVWRGDPLTPALVTALNPDADLDAVRAEAKYLQWPFAPAAAAATPKPKAKPQPKAKPKAKAKPQAKAKAKPQAKAKAKPQAKAKAKPQAKAKPTRSPKARPRPRAPARRR